MMLVIVVRLRLSLPKMPSWQSQSNFRSDNVVGAEFRRSAEGQPASMTFSVGTGLGRATVQRYLVAYRVGGLDGLRHWGVTGPVSDLAAFAERIQSDLTATPVRTTAEARDRIEAITGLHRGLTQTRTFLAGLGFTWQRTRAVPVPPKSP